MIKTLIKTRSILDSSIIFVTSILIVIIVSGAVWQVASRYLFSNPSLFTEELLRFLLIWIAFLGAAYVFGLQRHLAITFFKNKAKGKVYDSLQMLIDIIIIMFVALVLVKGGLTITFSTLGQLSPILRIPMGYIYSILPISGIVMIVYQLLNILDRIFNGNNPKQKQIENTLEMDVLSKGGDV